MLPPSSPMTFYGCKIEPNSLKPEHFYIYHTIPFTIVKTTLNLALQALHLQSQFLLTTMSFIFVCFHFSLCFVNTVHVPHGACTMKPDLGLGR